jgi:uncharacterized protein (DUF1800 family)
MSKATVYRLVRGVWSLLLVFCWLGNSALKAQPSTTITEADAIRLLEQATFGPNETAIAEAKLLGAEAWIEAQFSAPISWLPYYKPNPPNSTILCSIGTLAEQDICYRDKYTMYPLQQQFFKRAMIGKDQLRQRTAFALSQIFVVSGKQIIQPSSMAPYLDMLTESSFGNFRQLLQKVTLSPAMGTYLDMVNNDPPNLATGTAPNENYAREILQLFSIGTELLNQDGTPQLDINGKIIPSYPQSAIEGFAHVFTGWTSATQTGAIPMLHNPENFTKPMWLYRDPGGYDANHAKNEKILLNYPNAQWAVVPGYGDGETDLKRALDNIFFHPNVGPFIGKQLIQHLVTSNPSPAYVSRVAGVFNNNGGGVRGDLRAVIKAILLDPEARGASKIDAAYGKLREPVQYVLNLLRALNGTSTDYLHADLVKSMGQDLYYPPSVFNYFPPDYQLPNTSTLGPEFAIQSSSTAMMRLNFIHTVITGQQTNYAPANFTIDLAKYQAMAGDPIALVESLNRLLLHNSMSAAMKADVLKAVNAVETTNPKLRAQTAIYLVATSSQYQVQR